MLWPCGGIRKDFPHFGVSTVSGWDYKPMNAWVPHLCVYI